MSNIRTKIFALFILLFALLQGGAKAEPLAPQKLTYAISPVFEKDKVFLEVELSFQGDASGKTDLVLPSEWANQKYLYRGIQNLAPISSKTEIAETSKPFVKHLSYPPNQQIQLRYRLIQDWNGSLTYETYYRPILNEKYIHMLGTGLFIYPKWDEEQKRTILLNWKNVPTRWKLANSFGTNQPIQEFQASIQELVSGIYVFGEFHIYPLFVGKQPVYVALRGDWLFSDQEFTDLIQKILQTERDFWKDNSFPYYLVTSIQIDGKGSSGGTGLKNAFAAFFTAEVKNDSGLKHLLAHEMFHAWNPEKLGNFKEPEQLMYWFSEGFTEYYTWLLLSRSGILNSQEYINNVNDSLFDYWVSPVRNVDNQRILKDFWGDSAVQQLPYQRGRWLAQKWDTAIRTESQNKYSLDNVMFDLMSQDQKSTSMLDEKVIGTAVSKYTKHDVTADLQKYIEKGETIEPDKNALGNCTELVQTQRPTFELGFDLKALRATKRISGVKTDSAAYRAGVRNGQVVTARTIFLDPEKLAELKVQDGETTKTIQFFPEGSKIKLPQYRLNDTVSRDNCN